MARSMVWPEVSLQPRHAVLPGRVSGQQESVERFRQSLKSGSCSREASARHEDDSGMTESLLCHSREVADILSYNTAVVSCCPSEDVLVGLSGEADLGVKDSDHVVTSGAKLLGEHRRIHLVQEDARHGFRFCRSFCWASHNCSSLSATSLLRVIRSSISPG